jgi:hypothetical protein
MCLLFGDIKLNFPEAKHLNTFIALSNNDLSPATAK